MPMKKELKDAWVTDLRRDDIKQCDGVLESVDGANCCLGRLYRVTGHQPRFFPECSAMSFNADELVMLTETSFPSDEKLREWGLNDVYASDLAAMNDRGRTFREIADYIEGNPDI